MKNTLLAAGLMLPLFALPAFADPAATIAAVNKDANWLFIETADAMQFDGKVLTLSGADPAVVMFADRPHRVADSAPVAAFVDDWMKGGDDSFRANPPNAGITTLVDGKFQLVTVVLSEPRLEGSTLSFNAKVLEGVIPPSGGQTSVFIDGGCSPWDPRC
jgi:hypothetical protein